MAETSTDMLRAEGLLGQAGRSASVDWVQDSCTTLPACNLRIVQLARSDSKRRLYAGQLSLHEFPPSKRFRSVPMIMTGLVLMSAPLTQLPFSLHTMPLRRDPSIELRDVLLGEGCDRLTFIR